MNAEYLFFEGVATRSVQTGRGVRECRWTDTTPPAEPVGSLIGSVLEAAGLPVSSYRGRALQRRLPACLRYLRAATVEEAIRKLAERPEQNRAVLGVVLLGVSDFFRDLPVFDELRDNVLPELLGRRHPIRIWSAACSAGQELYSVAMLLAEAGRLGDAELLGTDCRSDAIEQARRGAFPFDALGSLEPARRQQFINPTGEGGVVIPALRDAIQWRTADLLTRTEPGPWDLVLWRNMAIYLEAGAASDIWRRVWAELAPDGFLVVGKADQVPQAFPLRRVGPCIYRKVPCS